MKLLSLHIANFGKLSNFTYNFSSGLNVINEQNGWGKTTLADFIRAMFYSLPQSRTRSVKENLRKKYKPWNGGEFGGNLCFEVNNEKYRIERTFGTTESEDTFTLTSLKTNKLSTDYSSNIGYELFGLDNESFAKTTYIPQLDFKINLTDNISAKLNNLSQDKDDVNSFNSAINLLDEKRKEFKKTGERGIFYDLKREIENINHEKQTYENINQSISDLEQNIKRLTNEISELEEQEKELNSKINASVQNEKIKNIQTLKAEINKIESELTSIENNLHGNIPTQKELDNYRIRLDESLKSIEKINLLKSQQQELSIQLNKKLEFFNNDISSEAASKIEQEYTNYKKPSVNIQTYSTKNNHKSIAIIGIFALILLSAISILYFTSIIPLNLYLIVACSIIVLSIATCIILSMRNKFGNNILKNNSQNEEKLNSLLNFNYDTQVNIDTKIFIFRENYNKYQELKNKLENIIQTLQELTQQYEKISNSLMDFKNFYTSDPDIEISDLIYSLTKQVAKFEQLKLSLDEKQQRFSMITQNINLSNIENQINIDELNVLDLSKKRDEIVKLLSSKRTELSNHNLKLERYKIKFDELDELLIKENDLKKQFEKISHTLNIIEETDKFLKLAKDELDSAFIVPIAENFKKHAQYLKAEDIINFNIDTDLNITINNNGTSKEIAYFSKGYQDIAYICARLSSIEAMFKNEKPFIILDDPFVNLDDEKLSLAKKLLENISQNHQIIYLVCHNSRA